MTDEELKNRFEAAQKLTIQEPAAQPLTGDEKSFDTQLVDTSGSALSQPQKQYDMNATTQEEPSPYEGAKGYLQRLIDTAGSRQAETVRDEKLARAQEAVLGIGDMGRAIANMVATTHYAPNGFQDSGLSDKARERAERAKAERDKHRDELLNYHMAMGKLGENERSWKFQREMAKERIRQADEAERRRQGEFELKNKMFEWKQQIQDQKFKQEDADRELKKMIAEKKISIEQAKNVKHELQEYTITKSYKFDPQTGKKIGEEVTRSVNNNGGTPSNSNTSTTQKTPNQGNRITVEY